LRPKAVYDRPIKELRNFKSKDYFEQKYKSLESRNREAVEAVVVTTEYDEEEKSEVIDESPDIKVIRKKQLLLDDKSIFNFEARKREDSSGSELKKLEDSEIEMESTPRSILQRFSINDYKWKKTPIVPGLDLSK